MDKRLIFQIDGSYYAMGYPTIDMLHNIIFGTGAKDAWKAAKEAPQDKKLESLIALTKDERWKNYKLFRWLQEPFPVFLKNGGYHGLIVLSSCAPVNPNENLWNQSQDVLLGYQTPESTELEVYASAASGPPVCVRPMLEPFDIATGKSRWTEVIRDHPDGKVVKMGSLYLDGNLVEGSIVLQGNADFCIDNTFDDAHTIEWTYHCGCLIPTKTIFRAYPSALLQLLGDPTKNQE